MEIIQQILVRLRLCNNLQAKARTSVRMLDELLILTHTYFPTWRVSKLAIFPFPICLPHYSNDFGFYFLLRINDDFISTR